VVNVPAEALSVRLPEKVLAALRATLPAPVVVRLLAPEITPSRTRVRRVLAAALPTVVAEPRVIADATVLLPEMLLRAPTEETPVPFSVIVSEAGTVMPPRTPRVAPLVTAVELVPEPRALTRSGD